MFCVREEYFGRSKLLFSCTFLSSTMAQKSGTYMCLRLIFVVLAFVALASSSCVDENEKALEEPFYYWFVYRYEKPEEEYSVKEMAAAAAEEYNRRSNSSCQYEALMDEGLKAFLWGEFAFGLCVQVTLEPKDSQNGELCADKEKMTCVIQAGTGSNEYNLHIYRDGLQCTAATA